MTSYPVLPSQKGAHYTSMEAYKKDYNASLTENSTYWGKAALKHLDWFTPFTSITNVGRSTPRRHSLVFKW